MVGAVGIEIASLLNKSNKDNGVAPPPLINWSLLEPGLSIQAISAVPNIWSRPDREPG
jgi:hypothetical protein